MSQDFGRIFVWRMENWQEDIAEEELETGFQIQSQYKEKGRNSVRKRSAQLHIRCREAKNSANR